MMTNSYCPSLPLNFAIVRDMLKSCFMPRSLRLSCNFNCSSDVGSVTTSKAWRRKDAVRHCPNKPQTPSLSFGVSFQPSTFQCWYVYCQLSQLVPMTSFRHLTFNCKPPSQDSPSHRLPRSTAMKPCKKRRGKMDPAIGLGSHGKSICKLSSVEP